MNTKEIASIHLTPLVLAAGLILTGCVAPGTSTEAKTTSVQYKLPTLTPVDPGKESQERDGIRITAAAYPFTAHRRSTFEYRRLVALLVLNGKLPAERREIPYLLVEPTNVVFKVRINNQLERVLRLAGTVVTFQVAGKQQVVEPSVNQNVANRIILPRQEMEFDIPGPAIDQMPDNATFAFYLYDIVTATDAAGNATKRSNFEWIYTLSKETKTEQLPGSTRKNISLSIPAIDRIRQSESGPYRWLAGLGNLE